MDDSTFDDLLRRKLKSYEDPDFDQEALDDFHARLVTVPTPWYANSYVRFAAVSTIAVLLLINGALVFKVWNTESPRPHTSAPAATTSVDSLQRVVAQLDRELADLRKAQATEPKPVNRNTPSLTMKPSAGLNDGVFEYYEVDRTALKSIPRDLLIVLNDNQMIVEHENRVFVRVPKTGHDGVNWYAYQPAAAIGPELPTFDMSSIASKPNKVKATKPGAPAGISMATKSKLEEHYFKGIGIQVAPHLDMMEGFYSGGSSLTFRGGAVTDWIVSPHLSIGTGLDYGTTQVQLGMNQMGNPPRRPYGDVESGKVINKLVSIPLSFKYRQWLTDRTQWTASVGYTPYWILSKTLQTTYAENDPNYPDRDAEHITILEQHNVKGFYGSTVTGSIGLTRSRPKNKGTWEGSLFYEHKIGDGFENGPTQLAGLRLGYWFRVK